MWMDRHSPRPNSFLCRIPRYHGVDTLSTVDAVSLRRYSRFVEATRHWFERINDRIWGGGRGLPVSGFR